MERDNLLERMETDHDIVRTELMTISEKYADQPVPSANKINELRKRVRAFGNVNVGAIEEFKTQKERQEFLTAQLNDLTSARESLFKVIEEIDGTIQRQFISTFKEIREGFQELFVRLFSGGKADLVLTDENDVLNTGIDIIASHQERNLSISLCCQMVSGHLQPLRCFWLLCILIRVLSVSLMKSMPVWMM